MASLVWNSCWSLGSGFSFNPPAEPRFAALTYPSTFSDATFHDEHVGVLSRHSREKQSQ